MEAEKHSGVKHSLNGDAVLKMLFHADAESYFQLCASSDRSVFVKHV